MMNVEKPESELYYNCKCKNNILWIVKHLKNDLKRKIHCACFYLF